jgi:hypothetical protein
MTDEINWWEVHANVVLLTSWMAENGASGQEIADAVEKLWKYTPEFEYVQSLQCPAGGEHTWTDDVDERYSDRRSRMYLPPNERWHRDECGAPMPKPLEQDL